MRQDKVQIWKKTVFNLSGPRSRLQYCLPYLNQEKDSGFVYMKACILPISLENPVVVSGTWIVLAMPVNSSYRKLGYPKSYVHFQCYNKVSQVAQVKYYCILSYQFYLCISHCNFWAMCQLCTTVLCWLQTLWFLNVKYWAGLFWWADSCAVVVPSCSLATQC